MLALDWRDYPDKFMMHVDYTPHSHRVFFRTNERNFISDDIQGVWVRRLRSAKSVNPLFDKTAQNFATGECSPIIDAMPYLLTCPWMSRPEHIIRANRKPYNLLIAQQEGFTITNTTFTNDPVLAAHFVQENQAVALKPVNTLWLEFPTKDAKPITEEQMLKNENIDVNLKVFYTKKFQADELIPTLGDVRNAPVILQQYIPKDLELRVTVVGERVFPCAIYSQEQVGNQEDWRRQEIEKLRHEAFTLPDAIEKLCIQLLKRLNLDFGCIDLILTPEGDYVFLEINPLGQWLWVEEKTGMPVGEAIVDLLLAKAEAAR